jgi:hypothetical protein
MAVLKPENSVVIAIATGLLVYAVYDRSLPNAAMMHATDSGDLSIESGRKKAAWTAAAVVFGVTALTKDVNPLVIGGATLFAFDWHARHANASNPDTGDLVSEAPGYTQRRVRSVA